MLSSGTPLRGTAIRAFSAATSGNRPGGTWRCAARGWALLCLAGGLARSAAGEPHPLEGLETPRAGVEVRIPGRNSREVVLRREDAFTAGTPERAKLVFEARLTRKWRSPVRISFHVQNRQGWYYQSSRLTAVPFDKWREIEVDFTPDSPAWDAVGHGRPWDEIAARGIFRGGVKLFAELSYEGALRIRNVAWRGEGAAWFRTPCEVIDLREPASPTGAGGLWEIAFRVSKPVRRPFDPGAADFFCDVFAPDGSARRVNAFYHQEYVPDGKGELVPMGASDWRVRFRPEAPGRYRYRLFLRDGDPGARARPDPYKVVLGEGRSQNAPPAAEGWFTVAGREEARAGAPGKDGPGKDGPEGALQDGEFVLDLDRDTAGAWRPELSSTPAIHFANGSEKDGKEGGTCFERRREPAPTRVWRAMLEWTCRWRQWEGLGAYDLALAWRFDRALEEAERKGKRLPCSLLDDEPFLQHGMYRWPVNPLSREEGGPIVGPGEFFTSTDAARHFLALSRYIIARYGHSPAIESWCLASGLPASGVADWHERVGRVIRKLDPACGVNNGKDKDEDGGRKIVSLHPFAVPFVKARNLGEFEKGQPSGWKLDRRDCMQVGLPGKDGAPGRLPVRPTPRGDPAGLSVSRARGQGEGGGDALEVTFGSRGWVTIARPLDETIFDYDYLTFDVKMPDGSSGVGRAQIVFRDRDLLWYERLLDVPLRAGDWTRCVVDLGTEAARVRPVGHTRPWNGYTRTRIKLLALRVFPNGESPGGAYIDHVRLHTIGGRAPRPVEVAVESAGPDTVGRFEKYEVVFRISREFSNPFDPDVVAVDGVFTDEDGEKTVVPAFFYEPYTRRAVRAKVKERWGENMRDVEVLDVAGSPDWRLRFAPTREGKYRVSIRIRTPEGTVERPGPSFQCVPSKQRGFIRIAEDNRYFEHSTGEFFFPVGPVFRSPADIRDMGRDPKIRDQMLASEHRGTYQFDEYLEALAKGGGNWMRMWMCSWWCGLEWYRAWPGYGGTGWYNLQNAWRFDHVLDTAEGLGIYVQLCLQNHGQTSERIDHEWEYNPYNRYEPDAMVNKDVLNKPVTVNPLHKGNPRFRRPAGWLEDAAEFFTDARARKAKRNLYRYIVARWGYSTNIFAWVLSSEVEFTGEYYKTQYGREDGELRAGNWRHSGPDMAVNTLRWHREMLAYVKKTDPWGHLVTTHFGHAHRGRKVLALKELDFVHSNAYTGYASLKWFKGPLNSAKCAPVPSVMRELYERYLGPYDKPVISSEWGGHWMRNSFDLLEAELQTGTWSSIMTPMAGGTGFWWWSHVHFRERYGVYAGVMRFMEGEDRRGLGLTLVAAELKKGKDAVEDVYVLALASDKQADVYICHREHSWKLDSAPPVEGATLSIPGLSRGSYIVEVWNTREGQPKKRQNAFSDGETPLKYNLPRIEGEVALKVRRDG